MACGSSQFHRGAWGGWITKPRRVTKIAKSEVRRSRGRRSFFARFALRAPSRLRAPDVRCPPIAPDDGICALITFILVQHPYAYRQRTDVARRGNSRTRWGSQSSQNWPVWSSCRAGSYMTSVMHDASSVRHGRSSFDGILNGAGQMRCRLPTPSELNKETHNDCQKECCRYKKSRKTGHSLAGVLYAFAAAGSSCAGSTGSRLPERRSL